MQSQWEVRLQVARFAIATRLAIRDRAIDDRARMDSDDAFSVYSTRTRPRLAIIDRSTASRVAIYYTILCYTIVL